MACPSVPGVVPGLGFQHLSAAPPPAARSSRGVPHGVPSSSADACCGVCAADLRCNAWLFRPGRCLLGNCSRRSACLERLHPLKTVGGSTLGSAGAALVCSRPEGSAPSAQPLAEGSHASGSAELPRLALLILGHRNRLMFGTVPSVLIQPLTRQVRGALLGSQSPARSSFSI
jgi:hypothetical protein